MRAKSSHMSIALLFQDGFHGETEMTSDLGNDGNYRNPNVLVKGILNNNDSFARGSSSTPQPPEELDHVVEVLSKEL